MSEKGYKMPAIAWLRVTDYMHAWVQHELGSALRIKGQRVVSMQHLPDAREAFRMETESRVVGEQRMDSALSATWKNCIDAGLDLDPSAIEQTYGINAEELKMFIPIECPKNCMTKNGVLRPWTNDVSFGARQAAALQKILRDAFWAAVEKYDEAYAWKMEGRRYPAINMIEDFCADTGTPDEYAAAIRREWQRRLGRKKAEAEAK